MTDQIYIPFIPEVRKQMSSSEYEVFALCYALDQRDKKIYFSNNYLGEMLGKTKRTITLILAKLEKAGFIKRIQSATGRLIEVVHDKIKQLCKKLPEGRKKQHPAPVKKTTPNNIDSDNKINEKTPLVFVEEFFNELAKDYDIEIGEMAETFINKYLSGNLYKKNIGNWQGIARNFFKYWLKNEEGRGNTPRKLAKWEKAYRTYKDAVRVKVNGKIYDVKDRQVIFESGKYPLGKLIKEWYADKSKFTFEVSMV